MDEAEICVVEDCTRPVRCRGYCQPHYRRVLRTGSPGTVPIRDYSPPGTVPHGTLQGYNFHGCRCEKCHAKMREYKRKWDSEHPDELHRYFRDCHLKKKYGMTQDDFDAMIVMQGGGCAICGGDDRDGRKRYLEVDHDHLTGTVRGILCNECNRGIGNFLDNPDMLRAAADYLEQVRVV